MITGKFIIRNRTNFKKKIEYLQCGYAKRVSKLKKLLILLPILYRVGYNGRNNRFLAKKCLDAHFFYKICTFTLF